MTSRPPVSPEGAEPDPVMLALLANRRRSTNRLSAGQERLIDEWVAGRLPPEQAEQAETLTRDNAWAAERVLERRLITAADAGPAVPEGLTRRVLTDVPSMAAPARPAGWRSLRRSWIGLLGIVAMAAVLAVAMMPLLESHFRGEAAMQVALATIGDRSALFEPTDLRMRGPSPSLADRRFRDIEMPTGLLRDLVQAGEGASLAPATRRALGAYLPEGPNSPPRVILDSALKDALGRVTEDSVPLRLYDLADPRAADIRKLLGLPEQGKAWLLTVKP
jgi:hypothetical protein